MRKHLKVIWLGFLIWLIPFVVSFAIFPLKTSNRALFESIMPVVVTACVVLFSIVYFRRTQAGFLRASVFVAVVWTALSLVLDLCLFMEGPMKMSLGSYMADIGLVYLIIPIVSIGFGYVLQLKARF